MDVLYCPTPTQHFNITVKAANATLGTPITNWWKCHNIYIFSKYYTNIPCHYGQYTRIFSQGTLNYMDVLYCPTPTQLYITKIISPV
jgi:hypothetical protein